MVGGQSNQVSEADSGTLKVNVSTLGRTNAQSVHDYTNGVVASSDCRRIVSS